MAIREQINARNRERYVKMKEAEASRVTRRGRRWTGAELETLARTDLTIREVAALLGRSYASVQTARQKLAVRAGVKTITKHGVSGFTRGCRCDPCRAAKYADEDGRGRNVERQAKTLDGAKRRGNEWTGPELEIAAREDLTISQAAAMLGRSYSSVASARHRIKKEPRVSQLAGIPAAPSDPGSGT